MPPRMPEEIRRGVEEKGGLEGILRDVPSKKELENTAKIHSALGDPLRLRIICFLRVQESCVCLLREVVKIPYSKLSYHLSVLKNAGLIRGEKKANYIIYSLTSLGKKYAEDACKRET